MKLIVGMTLAPREKEEVNQTIASFRQAGFDNTIHIYAEPGEYKIKDKNIKLNIHKEKKGCFKNFDYTFKELLKKDGDYILVLQDDFLIQKYAKKSIQQVISIKGEKFGFMSLNTRHYSNYLEEEIYKQGWNANTLGWRFSPAFFLFSKWGAKQIVKHPFYINHLNNYEKNQQVDACIGETCKQLGLEMYNHNPSLSIQRGETSTIGHNPKYVQTEAGSRETELVYGGIASIPAREKALEKSIKSIILQVDKLFIALNGYKEVPERLQELKQSHNIDIRITDNTRGDTEKFYGSNKLRSGYYFTFDDDLQYRYDYVKELISKIEIYNRKAVVGTHGARFLEEIQTYYKSREMYGYNKTLPQDTNVNILGTGTTGFHTDTIKPNFNSWKEANMTDVHLGIQANNQNVEMICVAHTDNYITDIEDTQKESIFARHKSNDDIQTDKVKQVSWNRKKRQSKPLLLNIEPTKIKVKLLRPIYPYKSGEIMMMDEKKAYYFRNQVEIIKEEEVKVEPKKQVKKKKNKAILENKSNKGLH